MGKKIAALLTILAIIFTVTICTPDSNAGIQTLNLSKQTKEIKVGESFQLSMTGVKASTIKWKSSKPGVATVTKKGVVKGVKAGTANITGKYKNLKFTIKVTVTGSSSPKTPEKNTETPSVSSTDVLLGSKANVEIYYVKVKENRLYLKVINKNAYNIKLNFEFINIDNSTFNKYTTELIMANNFRTIEVYDEDMKAPKKSLSTIFNIWNENYDDLGSINVNVNF